MIWPAFISDVYRFQIQAMSCQIIALSFFHFEFPEILCFWRWPTTNAFPWSWVKFSSWPSSSVYEWICAFLVRSCLMSSFALASFAVPQEIPRKGCHITFPNFCIWLYKILGQKQLFLSNSLPVFLRPWIKRVYPGIIIRCDLAFFILPFVCDIFISSRGSGLWTGDGFGYQYVGIEVTAHLSLEWARLVLKDKFFVSGYTCFLCGLCGVPPVVTCFHFSSSSLPFSYTERSNIRHITEY